MDCRDGLLEGLPQISEGEKAALDRELTLEELTARLTFSKKFVFFLEPDLYAVLLEFFLDLALFQSPANKQFFPCFQKRETTQGDQLPSSVQTTKCFPEPCPTG